jgi:hypothetical protein
MVLGDRTLGRKGLREGSVGRIAGGKLGGMMSLDPLRVMCDFAFDGDCESIYNLEGSDSDGIASQGWRMPDVCVGVGNKQQEKGKCNQSQLKSPRFDASHRGWSCRSNFISYARCMQPLTTSPSHPSQPTR